MSLTHSFLSAITGCKEHDFLFQDAQAPSVGVASPPPPPPTPLPLLSLSLARTSRAVSPRSNQTTREENSRTRSNRIVARATAYICRRVELAQGPRTVSGRGVNLRACLPAPSRRALLVQLRRLLSVVNSLYPLPGERLGDSGQWRGDS